MKDDKSIDLEAFARLVNWLIERGVNGIVVNGTTGENPCLDDQEWTQTSATAINVAAKRVPVILNTGTNSTCRSIARTKLAQSLGADGAMAVCPYYNKPTQEGLIMHFVAIATECPSLPVVLYNVPGRTSVDMLPESVATVVKQCPNVIGIKECSGDLSRFPELKTKCGPSFCVLTGEDGQACETILGGHCDGVVSVTGNVVPQQMAEMVHLALDGKTSEASAADLLLSDLHKQLFVQPNPTVAKWLLGNMGYGSPTALRLPLVAMSSHHELPVDEALKKALNPKQS
eukprot:CAMPEP_0113845514 /NCGR_PEP_ID=MMETSP0372-20130328/800_1 /TAXON_ID=340204 /ORGANISM="Lankesteria abbotti" /LENGTH=286 /DNA_ID=CAMNT_0000814567 /DNA_START=221 /DNA_END=1081 /DNA_ORIENTATION=- /assembly_acc=CAM_ASM_000359